MRPILQLAIKDIKLLLRDKLGAFFILGFPILMGVFFGMVMGGNSSKNRAKMQLAIVDLDRSEISQAFVDSLIENESLDIQAAGFEDARESIRKGNRVGMVVLPKGFGKTAGILWETAPTIQIGIDPSRKAEAAMVQGFVMESMGGLIGHRFTNPSTIRPFVDKSIKEVEDSKEIGFVQRQALKALFGSLDTMITSIESLNEEDQAAGDVTNANSPSFQFANIESIDITRKLNPNSRKAQTKKLRSPWDLSFPQSMMWGVLACCAGFAISIAREHSMGTMLRLQASPLTRTQILGGKALACFLTVLGVIALMIGIGIALGMAPLSYPKLVVSALCVAFCFVGIMMTMAVLGKTEQSVNGTGWAINMVMAMLGGGMIPVMFMPSFMQQLSVVSPVKWSIQAIEGAIWRDFSYLELALPCGILIAFGVAGMLVGSIILNRRKLS